jgi:uncharacterized small protein (DUF1192 family)
LADDLVARTRRELEQRIAELEALTAELPRLKAALKALGGSGEAVQRRRSRESSPARKDGRRRPRGANRRAILAVIEERPGVSIGEVAAVVAKDGVGRNVTYATVAKLAKDGVIAKEKGSLAVISDKSAA